MTFNSTLDRNLFPDDKIQAAALGEDRGRTMYEKNAAALDASRLMGDEYTMRTRDPYGIAAAPNIMLQVATMRRAEEQQRKIASNPAFGYPTEIPNRDAGLAGAGDGGYLHPPFWKSGCGEGYIHHTTGSGQMGVSSLYQGVGGGGGGAIPLLIPALTVAGSLLGPLVSRGINALIDWVGKKIKGKGKLRTASGGLKKKDLRRMAHMALGQAEDFLKGLDEKIMGTAGTGSFWSKLLQGLMTGMQGVMGKMMPGLAIPSEILKGVTSSLFTGSGEGMKIGLLSPSQYKSLTSTTGGEYGLGSDGGFLTSGFILRPIIENIVDKVIGKGLNVEEKQEVLNAITDAGQDILSEKMPAVGDGAYGGGSIWSWLKDRAKQLFRTVADLPPVRAILDKIRTAVGEKLPQRMKEFAETGVERLFDLVPPGTIKSAITPFRDTAATMAGRIAEKAGQVFATNAQNVAERIVAERAGTAPISMPLPEIERLREVQQAATVLPPEPSGWVEPGTEGFGYYARYPTRTHHPERYGRVGYPNPFAKPKKYRYDPYTSKIMKKKSGKGGWKIKLTQ